MEIDNQKPFLAFCNVIEIASRMSPLLLALSILPGCLNSDTSDYHGVITMTEKREGIHLDILYPPVRLPERVMNSSENVVSICVRARHFQNQNLKTLTPLRFVETIDLRKTKISGRDAAKILAEFKALRNVCVSDTSVSRDLFELLDPEKVETLIVSNCKFRSSDLCDLKRFKNLHTLDLSWNIEIKDEGLDVLQNIISLELLDLSGTSVKGNFIKFLKNKRIRILNVAKTSFESEQLELLLFLKELQVLDLSSNVHINSDSIQQLVNCTSLCELNLGGTDIDDGACRYLKRIPTLYRLHLYDCDISEGALFDTLESLPDLESLDVTGVGISPNGIARIRMMGIQVRVD